MQESRRSGQELIPKLKEPRRVHGASGVVPGDCIDNVVLDECEDDPGPPITQQPADAEVQEGDLALFKH